MRVAGNAVPEIIHIEPYAREPGKVEVRLRENIQEVSRLDEDTGAAYTAYEYDEYLFRLVDKPGLRAHIEENISDYLATGRVMEYNAQASAVADMRNALAIMGVSE